MGFNPLKEKGIPLEKQLRNWSELNVKPLDKNEIDPYTQCRIIVMNGIETAGIFFSHEFNRHCADLDLKRKLATTRRIEQQQQKAVNWLTPKGASPLEITIGYEQVAVDLTAWLAQNEPDPYFKQVLDFALLEDFDHLYRYADLLDLLEGKKAEKITGPLTEITVGRPTFLEHRDPHDEIRRPLAKACHPLSKLHAITITAAEQQTMNFYMNAGPLPEHPLAKALYQEIAMIEEQHVTHYGSMINPEQSWLERLLWMEYNECYMYHSFASQETDSRVKKLWEMHLEMELTHLQTVVQLMKDHEKRDATELLPESLPEPVLFQSNIDYVRKVLAEQHHLTADETEFVAVSELPDTHRYFAYQSKVNSGSFVPSEEVINQYKAQHNGKDYRQEIAGPHPVEAYKQEDKALTPKKAIESIAK